MISHTIQTPILLSSNRLIAYVDSNHETMNLFQKAKLYDRNTNATVALYLPIMISEYIKYMDKVDLYDDEVANCTIISQKKW